MERRTSSNLLDSKKFLSDSELDELRTKLSSNVCRDSLMLDILLTYGLRANEMLGLRVCDLNPTEKSMFVHGLKGSNDREFPLSDDHFERIMQIVKLRKINDYDKIFSVKYRRLVNIWIQWRPAKKKLHSLRHTCAVMAYRQTHDIKFVQLLLGHKSLTTTLIYQQFVYTQDKFREILITRA